MGKYGRHRVLYEKVYEAPLIKRVKDRPTCKNCGQPLKPYYHFTLSKRDHPGTNNWNSTYTLVFKGEYGYEGNNYFCSQRCGYTFAVAVAERIYKKEDGDGG